MKSFDDNSIVGVGDDPEKALKDAEAKGFTTPVLLYIYTGRRCCAYLPLLCVKSFLANFVLTIDYHQKVFSLFLP